jgi:hypothetical protein
MRLKDVATVIRSKNAGPYIFTFDILFPDKQSFDRMTAAGKLDRAAIAKAYNISPNELIAFEYYEFAKALKFSMRRAVPSGSVGDSDVYGAQQHAPLLDLDAW